MLSITPLYAAPIGLLFLLLSVNVIRQRLALKVSVGDGGEKALIKAMRAQSNCAEYAPLTLLLIAMAELQGGPNWLIHMLGSLLLLGRLAHAYGFATDATNYFSTQIRHVPHICRAFACLCELSRLGFLSASEKKMCFCTFPLAAQRGIY